MAPSDSPRGGVGSHALHDVCRALSTRYIPMQVLTSERLRRNVLCSAPPAVALPEDSGCDVQSLRAAAGLRPHGTDYFRADIDISVPSGYYEVVEMASPLT